MRRHLLTSHSESSASLSPVILSKESTRNRYAILRTVESGDHRSLSALLAWSGYRHEVDDDGNGPLHIASLKNDLNMVRLLLDAMEEDKVMKHAAPQSASAPDPKQGLEPTSIVSNRFQVPITNKSGDTPLHLAASKGHERVVKFLLKRDFDVSLANADGNTPLHVAALHEPVVRVLIEHGADPQKMN